jgi:molybdopterin converting factor subunit 1
MRVLLFAQLKDAAGCGEVILSPASSLTADELWAALLERAPGLAKHRPYVRLARNSEYVTSETRFETTDEVALIPPVSGG